MCLLRKITYGEFSEFIREKKITYNLHIFEGMDTIPNTYTHLLIVAHVCAFM